jgi:predicted Zn-dependent protease
MKKLLMVVVVLTTIAACATSPLGRKQFLMQSEAQMAQMGAEAYSQMKEKQPLSADEKQVAYVQCVTDALLAVHPDPKGWEVNVFADDSANAFALPGKKIGVHTGLLKVAKTPDQLAAVIGHEIGHVDAQHSNERMTLQYATQTGIQLAQILAGESDSENKAMIMGVLGLGAQYGVVLPFSRKHEAEADIIGLQFMAKAGFNPQASIELWMNMANASGGSPPEFMSTHPSHDTRIGGLQHHMPEAGKLYQQALAAGRKPNCG